MLGSLGTGLASVPTGLDSVPTADGTGNGSSVVTPAVRASLVWSYSASLYLGTDNVDAKTTYGAGAIDGTSTLHVGGDTVYLPFTTVGGNPSIGTVVYMASSADDGKHRTRQGYGNDS